MTCEPIFAKGTYLAHLVLQVSTASEDQTAITGQQNQPRRTSSQAADLTTNN